MEDFELLNQYARHGDQQAFASLLRRHVDMVYAICLRRLRDPGAADDATQAVFVALARRAGSINRGTVIAGWLYQAAVYESAQIVRAGHIRRRHEMAAAEMRDPVADASPPKNDDVDIDRALQQLRPAERGAIVLRFLQGRRLAEVAVEMRTSEEAARKRVARGLEKLRRLLRPAGAVGTSVVVVEQLLTSTVHAAPSAVTTAALKAAAAVPAVQAAALTTIAKGMVIKLAYTKTTTAFAALIVALLVGSAGIVTYRVLHSPTRQPVPPAKDLVNVAPVPAMAAQPDDGWRMKFNAVYALAPGETLKQVPLPFIPEREELFDAQQKALAGGPGIIHVTATERLAIEWDELSEPHWVSMHLNEVLLADVLQSCMGLKWWEIDADSLPLHMRLPGDWVYRRGSPVEQRMDTLSKILSKRLGRQLRFQKRSIVRDTIVVGGQYHYTHLDGFPDNGTIQYVGDPIMINELAYHNPVQRVPLRQVLERVSDVTGLRIFDETNASDFKVLVLDPGAINGGEGGDAFVRNIATQTGLRFTHEQRLIGVWSLYDADGAVTTAVPPAFAKQYGLASGETFRRVRPPYGPERQVFSEVMGGEQDGPAGRSLVIEADGPRFNIRSWAGTSTLEMLLSGGFHVDWLTIDQSVPKYTPISGDIVIRSGMSTEQQMAVAGGLMSDELGRPVHFERRSMPCDVVVASGSGIEPPGNAEPVVFTDNTRRKRSRPCSARRLKRSSKLTCRRC